MKKYLKTTFVLTGIILIVFMVYVLYIVCDPIYDKKNKNLSENDIQTLINKGKNCFNYYYYVNSENRLISSKTKLVSSKSHDFSVIKKEFWVKDNILKEVITMSDGGQSILWEDTTTGESLAILYGSKSIIKTNTKEGATGIAENFFNNSIFNNEKNLKYKYLGETKIADRNVICIKLHNNFYSEYYYIDSETGLILKSKNKNIFEKTITETKYITFNQVTNQDVEKPDISAYKSYN